MIEDELRLAVSGTFSTGKSTTAEILSIATGIPLTRAMTAHEFLRDLVPGGGSEELSARELAALGLGRLEARIHREAAQSGSFVSDGSVIQEWVYGVAKMQLGVDPKAVLPPRLLTGIAGTPRRKTYKQYMDAYGAIVKAYAKRSCDGYVHLPVEFQPSPDRRHPVSERFRKLSDELLVQTFNELNVPHLTVGGTIRERIARIIDLFGLPLRMSLDEAISIGKGRVTGAAELVDMNAWAHTMCRPGAKLRRLKYAML
ncbi:AAA domain-containing protein [Actinomadura pelletieri DSM 43383]|uniref:AAA domain-containing protein n=1 Tax=Actinomadura pelletieri DSM 43383 TaxID=1120940 RepID=A0A495QGC8_9ACTN|nr:AAA family ATPase [Actinomadura pelletieri]RKS70970.1 AAA domain-containing protein [Actinomadura pelletieri DSM 43383]